MLISFNKIAYSDGCELCDNSIPWTNFSQGLTAYYPSCTFKVFFKFRNCPTNIHEVKIDSVQIQSGTGNMDSLLANGEKKILSDLSLYWGASSNTSGTIRIKKNTCWNPSTFLPCSDTACTSTDYTVGRSTSGDTNYYSVSTAGHYVSTSTCGGMTGGGCTNKSNIYVHSSTIVSQYPVAPPDADCQDYCFWKKTGNQLDFDDVSTTDLWFGSRNYKDVIFKTGTSGNPNSPTEKMRLSKDGYLGIGQPHPDEALHIGNYFTFHPGANYYYLGFNDHMTSNGRARWENNYNSTGTHDQFAAALTFYSSQNNDDGTIELGTAGKGPKDQLLHYNEDNNAAGHNAGYRGLSIRPSKVETSSNIYGLIGLGTFPLSETNRVLIKGLGSDNTTSALNVTNNGGSSKLFVRDDGNVGIGTNSPKEILQIGNHLTFSDTWDKTFYINSYFDHTDDDFANWKTKSIDHTFPSMALGVTGAGDNEGGYIYIDKKTTDATNCFQFYNNGYGSDNLMKGIRLLTDGKVGISKYVPTSMLHIHGAGSGINATTSSLNIEDHTGTSMLFVSDMGSVGIGTTSVLSQHKLTVNGKVRIGTNYVHSNNTSYFNECLLSVDGTIIAPKVVVSSSEWSDFVFNKDYKLMPLNELELKIKADKHLPEIPSENEIKEKGGVDLGQMNVKLLQKVEELTLYLIELKKQSDKLAEENKEIKAQLNNVKRK